jgi:SOS-response transcriptional repressor LexA
MGISNRLKQAREALGLKQTEIAKNLGVQSNFLSNIERGEKKPTKELIELFSSHYKINANWILTGEGDMTIGNDVNEVSPLIKEMKILINGVTSEKFSEIESRLSAIETIIGTEKPVPKAAARDGSLYTAEPTPAYGEEKEERIPYVWDIAAGPPITQSDDSGETVSVPSRLLKKGERYYVASVRGGSMIEAGIRDGDRIIIRCADVPKDGAIQVIRYKDKSTLKRLRQTAKGWELHYEDGSGRVISGDSADYEVQGEFIAVLLPVAANRKEL